MPRIICDTYKCSPDVLNNACITFGVFDGLHKGHLYEIDACINDAKTNNKKSAILTFDIDPDEIFQKNFNKLLTNEKRLDMLEASGVDNLVILEFNESLKKCLPDIFLNSFFIPNTPYSIHVGQNFKFGSKQSGNMDLLYSWSQNNNVNLHVHDLVRDKNNNIISSTLLRKNNNKKTF